MLELLKDWLWYESGGPKVFGWYHFLWLGIMILLSVVLCVLFARKHNSKTDKIVILSIGIFLVIFELFKQIFIYSIEGEYNWSDFPFQFCSIPMYFALSTLFLKKEKYKEEVYKFLASFGLLAGLAVMIYPLTVFHTEYMFILIHTMMWHSLMVVMGVYLVVARGYGKKIKELLFPSFLFVSVMVVAIICNIGTYIVYFSREDISFVGEFNLLYISPYYSNPIPILGNIKEMVSFPVFCIIYLLAFLIGVLVLWTIIFGIKKLYINTIYKKLYNK